MNPDPPGTWPVAGNIPGTAYGVCIHGGYAPPGAGTNGGGPSLADDWGDAPGGGGMNGVTGRERDICQRFKNSRFKWSTGRETLNYV